MSNSTHQASEAILVLCHSFFHDAFQLRKPVSVKSFEIWRSSRFIANLIIEIKAELPIGHSFAVTSKPCFDGFRDKFYGAYPSEKTIKVLSVLRDAIEVIDRPSINRLSDDDGIFFICDTLYSLTNYSPILVTNIPKNREKATTFYRNKSGVIEIPYPIHNVEETEHYLRETFPELCKVVDKRISEGR